MCLLDSIHHTDGEKSCLPALLSLAALSVLTSCEKTHPSKGNTPSTDPPSPSIEPSAPPLTDWPITRGTSSLQGYVDLPAPPKPSIEWTYSLESPSEAEAAVLGDTLILGDLQGLVYAFSLEKKKLLWTFATEDTIESAPALHAGRVFIGSSDQRFYALDLANGEELWSIDGDEKFSSSANLLEANDSVHLLVNGYDGTTRCLDPADGSEIWTYTTRDYINGTPALLQNRYVAFGGCDSVLHVLDATTGTAAGKITTDAQITNSVATYQDMIYAGNYANQVVAARIGDETPTWIYQGDDFPFFTAPAVDEAHVYIGCRDKSLHAIDRETGNPAWKFSTGGRIESSPVAFRDAVIFGSSDGRLYAVDSTTGKERWRLDLGEKLTAAPVFARNRLIIAGGRGTVFVIK
ncbi:MAG: PQQ-binding-like beta-propeller repeat protein [Verrucomicrobiales bacterium]